MSSEILGINLKSYANSVLFRLMLCKQPFAYSICVGEFFLILKIEIRHDFFYVDKQCTYIYTINSMKEMDGFWLYTKHLLCSVYSSSLRFSWKNICKLS